MLHVLLQLCRVLLQACRQEWWRDVSYSPGLCVENFLFVCTCLPAGAACVARFVVPPCPLVYKHHSLSLPDRDAFIMPLLLSSSSAWCCWLHDCCCCWCWCCLLLLAACCWCCCMRSVNIFSATCLYFYIKTSAVTSTNFGSIGFSL